MFEMCLIRNKILSGFEKNKYNKKRENMKEEIEEIKKDNVSELRKIAEKTFYDTFKDSYTDENFKKFFKENYNETKLLSEIVHHQSFHYFYKVDDEIAGYLKLNINETQTEPKGDQYLEIQRIYFDKDYQGGGRGSQFIQLAIDKAREYNKSKIWLGVWENNLSAIDFYKKQGFEITGHHDFINGNVIDMDLIMEKEI